MSKRVWRIVGIGGGFALLFCVIYWWPVLLPVLPKRFLISLLIPLGLALVVAAVWLLPKWQVRRLKGQATEDRRLELEIEARRTITQIVGGAFFLATLYFTWANLQVTSEGQRKNLEATQENLRIALEGQLTDRFAKAVELLADKEERLEARLGGIYALERIARDSKKDHWTVMEVLTAFVREQAKWIPETEDKETPLRDVKPPRADIQAILAVLGRRERSNEQGGGRRLHLEGTNLRMIPLTGVHLEAAVLRGVHLERADLRFTRLEGADLREAHLKEAILRFTHLEEAILIGAHLQEADFFGAHLERAGLVRAHLEGADLRGAHLEKAVLRGAIGLTRQQIARAHCYTKDRLPDDLRKLEDLPDKPHKE